MKKTILVLGNSAVKEDNHALWLIPNLRKLFPQVNFILHDPTEEIPQNLNGELFIIDTVTEIERVTQFDNLDYFRTSPRITLHDFDLPLSLGILMKLGKIKKVKIIGIPQKGNRKTILSDVIEKIEDLI